MTDVIRTYSIGDSVISTTALVAPPVEPPGVRLEIPAGCRGTVVDVRPYPYSKPYAVLFDVTDGASVEIDVNGAQIAGVKPPATGALKQFAPPRDVPPNRTGTRRLTAKALHTPSVRFPHYYCKALHATIAALLVAWYATILSVFPVWTLTASALALMMAYSIHLHRTHSWAFVPRILQRDEPTGSGELEVCEHCVPHAIAADIAFAAVLAVNVGYLITNLAQRTTGSQVVYMTLFGVTFVLWVARATFHERVAFVVSDND